MANSRKSSGGVGGYLRPAGFTLIETLIVVAIIALLAAILLPALSRTKAKSQTSRCQNNLRQLGTAWLLYSGDYNERFAPNVPSDTAGNSAEFASWVAGSLNYALDNPANTNVADLVGNRFGSIGAYSKVPGIYKCPSDSSRASFKGVLVPRIRSYSMNAFFGDSPQNHTLGAAYLSFPNSSSLSLTSPSDTWVLIDEHPDSLNDGYFWIPMIVNSPTTWEAVPASYHGGGANLFFADGHVAFKHWLDPRTQQPVRG